MTTQRKLGSHLRLRWATAVISWLQWRISSLLQYFFCADTAIEGVALVLRLGRNVVVGLVGLHSASTISHSGDVLLPIRQSCRAVSIYATRVHASEKMIDRAMKNGGTLWALVLSGVLFGFCCDCRMSKSEIRKIENGKFCGTFRIDLSVVERNRRTARFSPCGLHLR